MRILRQLVIVVAIGALFGLPQQAYATGAAITDMAGSNDADLAFAFGEKNVSDVPELSQQEMSETQGAVYHIVIRAGVTALVAASKHPVTRKLAAKALQEGKDVLASTYAQARSIARRASETGRVIHEAPHRPGQTPHFHDSQRRNGHAFYR